MKKDKARGWSVFWREQKQRWILSRVVGNEWVQKVLADAPHENTKAGERRALQIAQAWMAQQGERPADAIAKKPRGMTIAEASEKWLAIAEKKKNDGGLAPATLKDYRIDVKHYVLPPIRDVREEGGVAWVGGSLPLAELDVPRARRWLRAIRGTKSASTVRGARSSFARLYDCAVAEGWVRGDNPFDNSALLEELPPLPIPTPQVVPLAWMQAVVSDRATPLAWRVRYLLAVTSGARDGEIHGARICNLAIGEAPIVCDDGATVEPIPQWKITQAVAIVGREGFASDNNLKTASSHRTLPIHPAAVVALREWIQNGWRAWVGRAPSPADLLFPSPDGNASRPRSAENLRADLARLGLPVEIAGAPIEFKSLRATFATALHEAGVDEHTRKRLMGHASTSVTERHYTRREIAALAQAVATIPIRWVSGSVTDCDLVTEAGTIADDQAAPARVERATNGLGSPCDVLPGATPNEHEAPQTSEGGGSFEGRVSGDALAPCGSGHRAVVLPVTDSEVVVTARGIEFNSIWIDWGNA